MLCRELGLFGTALVAIDGCKLKAVNTRDRNFTAYRVKRRIEQVGAVRRVEILPDKVRLILIADCLTPAGRKGLTPQGDDLVMIVPMRCQLRGGRVEHILPPGAKRKRVKRDPTLIRGLQKAHQLAKAMGWCAGDGDLSDLAIKQPDTAYDRKLVRLAFLAPDIQRVILAGEQSPSLTLARLLHAPVPTDWSDQRRDYA